MTTNFLKDTQQLCNCKNLKLYHFTNSSLSKFREYMIFSRNLYSLPRPYLLGAIRDKFILRIWFNPIRFLLEKHVTESNGMFMIGNTDVVCQYKELGDEPRLLELKEFEDIYCTHAKEFLIKEQLKDLFHLFKIGCDKDVIINYMNEIGIEINEEIFDGTDESNIYRYS